MTNLTNPRFLCIPLLLLAIPFYIHRLFRARDTANRQFVLKLLTINILILVPSYNVYQESVHISLPWWQHSLGNAVLQAIVLLHYFTVDQFLHSHAPPVNVIIRKKEFLVTAAFLVMMVLVDYLRRGRFISVTDPQLFSRSWTYLAAQVSYNAPMIYVMSTMARMYRRGMAQYNERSFIVRCMLNMLGISVAVTIMLVALANTFVSFMVNNPFRVHAYAFVQDVGRPIVFLLIMLGSVVPERLFKKVMRPLDSYFAWRERQQHDLLRYLHKKMLQIVPSVHLPNEQLGELRVLTEIDDARDIIWGQENLARPMSPEGEADHLYKLLMENAILSQPGNHLPPSLNENVIKHNLAVAVRLKTLENQGRGWERKTVRA